MLTIPQASLAAQTLAAGAGSANRVLVRYEPGMSAERAAEIESGFGAGLLGAIPDIQVRVLEVPSAAADHVIEALQRLSDVDYAERDEVLQPQDVLPSDHAGNCRSTPSYFLDTASS